MISRYEEDAPAAAPQARRRRSRAEMIVVAVAVAAGALFGLGHFDGTFTDTFTDTLSAAERRAMAVELAAERVHAARVAGVHADTMATLESTIPGYPGFTRVTAVRRVGGRASDTASYRVVTTAVLASGLPTPVRKMAIIPLD